MGTFLLLLFIIFFVIPLLRVAFTVYTVRRKMRNAMRDIYAKQGERADGRQPRKAGWSSPGGSRKKIDGNVGEYVNFEELPAAPGDGDETAHSVRVNPEPQITDVDWEDIK